MISAGNDIVSFAATNFVRTSQPAFYTKILSEKEIAAYPQLYAHSLSFEVYVWLLWSVKEAVYKYLKRLDNELVFSPTRISVEKLDGTATSALATGCIQGQGFQSQEVWQGSVVSGNHSLFFCSLLYPDLVHSVVNDSENFEPVYWGIKAITELNYTAQSAAVREFVMARLHVIFPGTDLEIKKDAVGIPVIAGNPKLHFPLPVSFSHHGRYVAYSFCKDPSLGAF